MSDVWVVSQYYWDAWRIRAIFDSEESARRYAQLRSYKIEKHGVQSALFVEAEEQAILTCPHEEVWSFDMRCMACGATQSGLDKLSRSRQQITGGDS